MTGMPFTPVTAVDVALGLVSWTAETGTALGRKAARGTVTAVRPLLRAPASVAYHGSLDRLRPLARRGRDRRAALGDQLSRVLDVVVPAVADEVLDRLDLAGRAREVVDAIDLPEIIRESTGSMASETVHGVRMRGVAGDEIVSRAVDRLLPGRRARSGTDTAPP